MVPEMDLAEPTTNSNSEDQLLALYRDHGKKLFGYALGILRDRADAEDVVQEAFVRLDAHLRDQRSNPNLRAWLYRVVTNLARDVGRRRSRIGGEPEPVAGPEPKPLRRLALDRVLASLRPRERELVLMRGLGLSYAEMAEVLETLAASIGKQLSRALDQFHEAYEREVGEGDLS